MEHIKEYAGIIAGALGSIICFLFGEINTTVIVLLVAIGVDYVTGMANAIINKKLSSETGLKGFLKKIVLLLVVAFATQLDKVIGSEGMVHNFVIYYYIATEGLSILENVVALGVPVPDIIKNTLEQIREGKK